MVFAPACHRSHREGHTAHGRRPDVVSRGHVTQRAARKTRAERNIEHGTYLGPNSLTLMKKEAVRDTCETSPVAQNCSFSGKT